MATRTLEIAMLAGDFTMDFNPDMVANVGIEFRGIVSGSGFGLTVYRYRDLQYSFWASQDHARVYLTLDVLDSIGPNFAITTSTNYGWYRLDGFPQTDFQRRVSFGQEVETYPWTATFTLAARPGRDEHAARTNHEHRWRECRLGSIPHRGPTAVPTKRSHRFYQCRKKQEALFY